MQPCLVLVISLVLKDLLNRMQYTFQCCSFLTNRNINLDKVHRYSKKISIQHCVPSSMCKDSSKPLFVIPVCVYQTLIEPYRKDDKKDTFTTILCIYLGLVA